MLGRFPKSELLGIIIASDFRDTHLVTQLTAAAGKES